MMKRIADVMPGLAFVLALMMCIVTFSTSAPARADTSYQCEAGPNPAVVTACAARWEAANIRAHVAVGAYGGASANCLTKTAALLDQIATKSLSANKPLTFSGAWPCGKEPSVGKADDGALAQVCPHAVWSYDNKGSSRCSPSNQTQIATDQVKKATSPAEAITFIAGKLDQLQPLIFTNQLEGRLCNEDADYCKVFTNITWTFGGQHLSLSGCDLAYSFNIKSTDQYAKSHEDLQHLMLPRLDLFAVSASEASGNKIDVKNDSPSEGGSLTRTLNINLRTLTSNVRVTPFQTPAASDTLNGGTGILDAFDQVLPPPTATISIVFTDDDTATRVAHALSDAITSCGGKAESY